MFRMLVIENTIIVEVVERLLHRRGSRWCVRMLVLIGNFGVVVFNLLGANPLKCTHVMPAHPLNFYNFTVARAIGNNNIMAINTRRMYPIICAVVIPSSSC